MFTLLLLLLVNNLQSEILGTDRNQKKYFNFHKKNETEFVVWVKHPAINQGKPTAYKLVQIKNKNGVPIGYRLPVNSVVCLDSVCEIIKVSLYWDATGEYNHLELQQGKNLTKGPSVEDDSTVAIQDKGLSEHIHFSTSDYIKLDSILHDKYSLLKYHQLKEMTEPEAALEAKKTINVDAKSGATSETIKRSVIVGAAYTCYTLWHWANGNIPPICDSLTKLSCNPQLIQGFLKGDNQNHIFFAIKHLDKQKTFDETILQALLKIIQGSDNKRIEESLSEIKKKIPNQMIYDQYISVLFIRSNSSGRLVILTKLYNEDNISIKLLEQLGLYIPKLNTYYELNLVLSLLERCKYISKSILENTGNLLRSQDAFIARRAYSFLKKQPIVDASTGKQMDLYKKK